jgi:hypothetical protein
VQFLYHEAIRSCNAKLILNTLRDLRNNCTNIQDRNIHVINDHGGLKAITKQLDSCLETVKNSAVTSVSRGINFLLTLY